MTRPAFAPGGPQFRKCRICGHLKDRQTFAGQLGKRGVCGSCRALLRKGKMSEVVRLLHPQERQPPEEVEGETLRFAPDVEAKLAANHLEAEESPLRPQHETDGEFLSGVMLL